MVKLKDTFISLATAGYIQQAPVAELKDSEIPTLVPVATIIPDLDVRELIQAMSTNLSECNDSKYKTFFIASLCTLFFKSIYFLLMIILNKACRGAGPHSISTGRNEIFIEMYISISLLWCQGKARH